YSSVMPIIAMAIARGTVLAGFTTSPLGTSAVSMPRNANTSTSDARPTALARGGAVHARFSLRTAAIPTTMRIPSGSSLATVVAALKRFAPRTPSTFSVANPARITASAAARPPGEARPGANPPSASPRNDVTAAAAAVMPANSMMPTRKPTNGPNATSTYAYRPPVRATRLPASAKQRTMSPIAMAQATYAAGAAGPKAAAAAAGSRKIPPPTVTFTMAAASPHTPSARTSEPSFVSRVTG